jgi:hypothetical protein
MEETAQHFEKRFSINRSWICIALLNFYATHRNYEILSKSLVPSMHLPTVLLGNDALLVRVVMIKLTSRTRERDWKGGSEIEGLEREGKERESFMSGFPRIFSLSITKGVAVKLLLAGAS